MAILNEDDDRERELRIDNVEPDNLIEIQGESHQRIFGFEDSDTVVMPRFLRDQALRASHPRISPLYLHFWRRLVTWAKGPQPSQIHKIRPILPYIQEAPIRLLDACLPKKKDIVMLLTVFYFCWILSFGLVLRQSTLATDIEGLGEPNQIGCGNTFWLPANDCGINGVHCRPFYNSTWAFKCPANCASRHVLNPRAVGNQEINYRPFIIGGPKGGVAEPSTYRGDSFICGSAIHAGVIDNTVGGCGVVSLIGQQQNFISTNRNGITSIGFDSYFPLSFTFLQGISCESKDLRWSLLGVSLFFTILTSLFTTSPSVFFFTILTSIFFHVGLASDPPYHNTMTELISDILGKFLPAMFCAFVIYKYCVKRCLGGLTAQIEKTVLWLGGCWVGALSNYTLDWIPIQRLTSHDLEQQPGAKLSLALIIILLVFIVIKQIHYFRLEGRLPKYLGLYGVFVAAILFSLLIPGLNLRIHHYILALLLLPGTSMQTRPVLLYQGLLVGLFINGIARWGFDSVLQTPADLQGDARFDSLLPTVLEPIITLGLESSNISLRWAFPPSPFDGVSVLVNDVERFRGFVDEGYGLDKPFIWTRDPGLAELEYFRFAFMEGATTWDYTKAAIWNENGSWIEMEPGPSRVKAQSLDSETIVMKK
jgi:hypothetical protein